MKIGIKATSIISLLVTLFLPFGVSAQENSRVGGISITGSYSWAATGCSWTSWSYITYGRQRLLYCGSTRVATAFQNLAWGGCSLTANASGYSVASTSSCYKEVWSGQSLVTKWLSVRRHSTAPALGEAHADDILSDASTVLQDVDGTDDVACNVSLRRLGAVTTFTNGDGSIDNSAEFQALEGGVNFVDAINWCGQLSPNIIGCAEMPGDIIAVVQHADNEEGILWAHEFGHTQGLDHRDDANAIMNGIINVTREHVNSNECNSFR